MIFETLKNFYQEIDKIRGRSLNFAFIMEDKNDFELLFASTSQQIASELVEWLQCYSSPLIINSLAKTSLLTFSKINCDKGPASKNSSWIVVEDLKRGRFFLYFFFT